MFAKRFVQMDLSIEIKRLIIAMRGERSIFPGSFLLIHQFHQSSFLKENSFLKRIRTKIATQL